MINMNKFLNTKTNISRKTIAAFISIFITISSAAEAGKTNAEIGNSLSGNYLAGSHAQTKHNLSAAVDFLSAALNKAPSSPSLLQRIFALMIAGGRIEEAKTLAYKIINLKPKAAVAHLTLAIDEIKQGNYKQADTRLKALPPEGLIQFVAPALRAWSLVGQNKVSEAMKILQSPTKQNAIRILYSIHSALISEFFGRTEEAKKYYLEAQKNQTELSLRVVQLFGAFYERAGEKNKARKLYENYILNHPDSQLLDGPFKRLKTGDGTRLKSISVADGAAEVLFGISSLLRMRDDDETPLMLGRLSLYLKPQFPIMQILLGDILETSNRLKVALEIYESIHWGSSFSWPARLRMASILSRMNRFEEAVQHLNTMAQDRPEDPGPLINLGDILRGQERFIAAVNSYDRAFGRIKAIKPKHWSLLYARGIALERSKQWPKAEVDLLSALEFNPEQPYVLNYLGYSWIDKGLHLDRAQAMIGKAASLRPNDGYVIDSLGWGYYKLGKFRKAVQALERAAELRPQDPVINDHLGDAYWRVGRRREAVFQWRRSLSLEPNNDLVTELNQKLLSGLDEDTKTVKKFLNDG